MADRGGKDPGLEGLLRGIGSLFQQFADLSSELRRSSGQAGPVVESRMSIRTVDGEEIGNAFFGLGGEEEAGARDERPAAPDYREPPVELLVTDDAITALVELPGAEPASLVINLEHDMLTVTAKGRSVEYRTEALLPAPVVAEAREDSLRNGVLEITWPRAKAA